MPSAFSNINMAFLTPIHISTHHITQTFLSPTCCTQPPTPPPAQPQLPTNLPSTITFAAAAASKALATGATRIKVTALIPGLNPQLEEAVPYSSQTLYTLARGIAISTPALRTLSTTLLFPSSGDAAAAAAFYRREISEDASVRTASYFRRDGKEGRVSTDANVIVAPISSRGDRVMDDLESVISEAPDAIWVLLNADLDVDRASVGMAENERRASFIRAFINAFYFRNLFEVRRPKLTAVERGALYFSYPGPWSVYAIDEEAMGYYLVAEDDDMPRPDRITALIRARRKPVVVDNAGMDEEFVKVLLLCCIVFATVYSVIHFSKPNGFLL